MNDERFERDLTVVLRDIAGAEPPASLRYRLSTITDAPTAGRRSWLAPLLQLSAAAVVVVAIAAFGWVFFRAPIVGPNPTPTPGPSPSAPAPSVSPSPSVGPSPSESPSPSPSESPTSTASAAPAGPTGLVWSDPVVPFPYQPYVPSWPGTMTSIDDLMPWDGGYVGVGSISHGFQCEEAAFFRSSDGVHWAVTDRFSSGDQFISVMCPDFVVPASGGLLALGQRRIWSSVDGSSWTEIDSPTWRALWTSDLVELRAVAAGPAGVVAIGSDRDSGAAIVAHSTDGRVWERVTLPTQEQAIVRDVVSYPGGFVIGGRDGRPDGEASPQHPAIVPGIGRPAAWVSSDGVTWAAASVDGTAVQGGLVDQILVGADGLFAIGIDAPADDYTGAPITGWASSDGTDWRPIGTLGEDMPPMALFASDGSRIVALGLRPMGADMEPTAWVSIDGTDWSALAVSGSGPSADVRNVVLGEPRNDNPPDTALWVVRDGVIALGAGSADGQLPQGQPFRLGAIVVP